MHLGKPWGTFRSEVGGQDNQRMFIANYFKEVVCHVPDTTFDATTLHFCMFSNLKIFSLC